MVRYYFDEEMRRQHKWRNWLHTALLLTGMGGVLFACAYGLFGPEGAMITIAGCAFAVVVAPRIAPEWVIRAHKGTRLTHENFPGGTAIVKALAMKAGLSHIPAIYYIPSRMLNAFATGHTDRAAIALTDGMLRRLTSRELTGVIAHEISHIRNGDLWLMGVADMISRMMSGLSYIGMFALLFALPFGQFVMPLWVSLLLVIAPTIASLLQLALSRAREYDADLEAATLTGDPGGLASALAKLERIQGRYWEEILLPGRRMPDPSLLRTHPPTEERIARLQSLTGVEQYTAPAAFGGLGAWQVHQYPDPRPPRFIWPGFWC